MEKPITFITRHYPPNANINGESVWDMVKYLSENYGVESNIICIDRISDGGGNDRKPLGNVIRLKPLYQGKNAIGKFFSFLYEGYILVKKSLAYKDTLIVCTTSPPLLPFWAALLLRKNVKWALWSFDLFPEGFQVTKRISSRNIFYRWIKNKTYKSKPSFLIALGQQQAKHLQDNYKSEVPFMVLPCGVPFFQDKSESTPSWWEPDKIFIGYCGNIGDAHNPKVIEAAIDNFNPENQRIILALYGKHAERLKEYAKDRPGVIVVERVPRSQLHYIDIHMISLRKEWTHIAVPSKAVSAVFMGGGILFCGDQSSDNWHMFQDAGWFIEEGETLNQQIRDLLHTITIEDIQTKKHKTDELSKNLQQYVLDTYKGVYELLPS